MLCIGIPCIFGFRLHGVIIVCSLIICNICASIPPCYMNVPHHKPPPLNALNACTKDTDGLFSDLCTSHINQAIQVGFRTLEKHLPVINVAWRSDGPSEMFSLGTKWRNPHILAENLEHLDEMPPFFLGFAPAACCTIHVNVLTCLFLIFLAPLMRQVFRPGVPKTSSSPCYSYAFDLTRLHRVLAVLDG